MKKEKILLKVILVLVVLGIATVGLSIYMSKNMLTVTTYEQESEKVTEPVNALVISDVHSHAFGKNNERLMNRIVKESPDMILIIGDIVNYNDEDYKYLLDVVENLKTVAPVYYSIGNHESAMISDSKALSLEDDVRQAGAIVMNRNYFDVKVKEQEIRIGGMYGYAYNNLGLEENAFRESESYKFLQEYENTDNYKIYLAHEPQFFINDEEDARWDIDLVLSGHEHGGQVRVPFLGALYSRHEQMGWFPQYADGAHLLNGIPIVVSRGLGANTGDRTPPRFWNIPEIVKIRITPEVE